MAVIGWQGLWGMLAGRVAGRGGLAVAAGSVRRRAPCGGCHRRDRARPTRRRLRACSGRRACATRSRSRGPWRVAITFSMYSSQWLAVIGFLPSIYAQAGLSGQLAGLLTAFACLVNVIGNVAAGRLLHRGVCARHLLYAGFLAMAVTTFVAFSPLTAEAPVARYLAVVIFSAVGGLIPATLFALAVHVAPNEHTC